MKNSIYFLCLIFTFIVVGCATTDEGPLRGDALFTNADQLVSKLQKGGYVIYFRHAMTDWEQRDSDRNNLENCKTQRKLSEKGRAAGKSIGKAFEALNIPVGIVYSSPYCRCIDTGKLAFDDVSVTFDLKGLAETERQESERRVNVLKNMLATTPPTGRNTILISHSDNILKAANFSVNEGDAVVFKPLEADGFKLLAYITSDQWMDMARTLNMK